MNNPDERIIATASAPGMSERGIVRLSGPDVFHVVGRFFRVRGVEVNKPERPAILLGTLTLWPEEAVSLAVPCRLYFWPAGRGFTGQEAVELHLPGTPALLDATLAALVATGEVRMAGPGEFTLRAFLAGRIDLTQAEAVLGVIDAVDTRTLEAACEQLAGRLASELVRLRERLFDSLCLLEAGFDFAEEEIDFITNAELTRQLESAREQVDALCRRAVDRDGGTALPQIVLFGQANSGKSTLWNALCGRFTPGFGDTAVTALVSSEPGTTRDYLEQPIELAGRRFLLVDTAGREEESTSPVSVTAWSKTSERVRQAGVVLWCQARSAGPFNESERPQTNGVILPVVTKCDLPCGVEDSCGRSNAASDSGAVVTSAKCGLGLDTLSARIVALASSDESCEVVATTAHRCREALVTARADLTRALTLAARGDDDVLIAAELRHAIDQIGLITGQVCTEDLLDRIFSRFCIGK
ncbi:MAG: 50S ribosome-binding GTPase [Planctomycetia bacterium]|nr:50S ribosome-binding GTPase [Planctomycetia bacterium]